MRGIAKRRRREESADFGLAGDDREKGTLDVKAVRKQQVLFIECNRSHWSQVRGKISAGDKDGYARTGCLHAALANYTQNSLHIQQHACKA